MRVGDKDVPNLCEAALAAITEAVVITDAALDRPGPIIVYVNPAFEAMTGYVEKEVIGRSPRLLQGPATDRRVLDRLAAALKTTGRLHGEAINYRKDGSPFVVEWVISGIRDDEGVLTHWVAAQRDITVSRASADQQRVLYAEVLAQVTRTNDSLLRLVTHGKGDPD